MACLFGAILRDEVASDESLDLLVADNPVLETGDLHYGDLNVHKEVDQMMPNASWTHGDDLQVEVSGRNYLSTALLFEVVGTWVPTLEEGKLTFPAQQHGRILRYRFTGLALRGLKFDAYTDGIYMHGAEK